MQILIRNNNLSNHPKRTNSFCFLFLTNIPEIIIIATFMKQFFKNSTDLVKVKYWIKLFTMVAKSCHVACMTMGNTFIALSFPYEVPSLPTFCIRHCHRSESHFLRLPFPLLHWFQFCAKLRITREQYIISHRYSS
jgi:hypothetical protein